MKEKMDSVSSLYIFLQFIQLLYAQNTHQQEFSKFSCIFLKKSAQFFLGASIIKIPANSSVRKQDLKNNQKKMMLHDEHTRLLIEQIRYYINFYPELIFPHPLFTYPVGIERFFITMFKRKLKFCLRLDIFYMLFVFYTFRFVSI